MLSDESGQQQAAGSKWHENELAWICPRRQKKLLRCALTALMNKVFPGTRSPRHTDEAGLWLGLGLGLEFRVGMVAAASRSRKTCQVPGMISPSAREPLTLVTKPYFIETASFYAGTK